MTRRKRSRGLVILISVIVALLVAEAALVVFVFVSPGAKDELGGVAESVQRIWYGTEGDPGIRTRTARAAHEAYEDWIVPIWEDLEPPPLDPDFTACVECHPDYATQKKFNVYMDHPLHAELGMACETCHPQNPHPNPPRPQESACAECHDQVDDKEQCSYCHPPASLPHFYYFGAPKQSVVDCSVCHPKETFDVGKPTSKVVLGIFDGSDQQECLSCHQDSSCESCHGQPHPLGWVGLHSSTVLKSSATQCYACHLGTWCSDRCHAGVPPRPIPSVGVRP
jgi:hypothetical protein